MVARPRKIRLNDWRYKLAQFVLRLLYGRKWHYISPWRQAGVACGVVCFYNERVLMGRRRGNIEGVGRLHFLGGHLELEENESVAAAGAREVKEEAGIDIDSGRIHVASLVHYYLKVNADYLETEDGSVLILYHAYQLSDAEYAQLHESEEFHNFALYTLNEVRALENELFYPECMTVIERAFAHVAAGKPA